MLHLIMACVLAHAPVVVVDRDNVQITESCTVKIADHPIPDTDGNGVIHITVDGVTADFAGSILCGNSPDQLPDSFTGTGVRITAKNVTVRKLKVGGYKVGIHATTADGLIVHTCDISNNFHQRLKSTAQAEDASDWLWPHANDGNEWITNYGAGLCVEDSSNVTIHDIKARKTQNGIILDRVDDSKVFDCDCSFLSGWGLAMWRSNRNSISRNAFDFCVRGYSHGVYNRGQDSAGILMFEQCCENVFAENSCTHGGDGFFGFAGKEALGEVNPRIDLPWYEQRGCNENLFVSNDFSYAAAHGLELTFSFKNRAHDNRFTENAICGIWAGYSQAFIIDHNVFSSNGAGGYGPERGGINIEHGAYNMIVRNRHQADAVAIRLFWDEDAPLAALPWTQVNGALSTNNAVIDNRFNMMNVALELCMTDNTIVAENQYRDVEKHVAADDQSKASLSETNARDLSRMPAPDRIMVGDRNPVGSRGRFAGRKNIIMTEWGPWDHESPLLQFVQRLDHADEYRLLGTTSIPPAEHITVEGEVQVEIEADRFRILPKAIDTLIPYSISFQIDGHLLAARGLLSGGSWTVKTFPSVVDPREDAERWRAEGLAHPNLQTLTCDPLDLRFGNGSMSEARGLPVILPTDHFGCIATQTVTIPAGAWRLKTTSDDGIRVWMNDELVIDDWTHHGPTPNDHEFVLTEPTKVDFRVEYFELDGFATLQGAIIPAE